MSGHIDAIVIGAGQAGIPLAVRLAEAGYTVVLIERDKLGGTCVNTGCTPTKAMIASAYVAHAARRGMDFGVRITGTIEADLRAIVARKDKIVADSKESLEQLVATLGSCRIIFGNAHFSGEHTVSVNGEELSADRIFLNVGARPILPVMRGLADIHPFTSDTLLQLQELPRHLVIIGGGYISLEFGQMFRRFGSAVTIIEMEQRLLPQEDEDFAEAVEDVLRSENIDVRIGAECTWFSSMDGSPVVHFAISDAEYEIEGSHVLLAVGRIPNTDSLNLECARVSVDSRGFIKVNDTLETTAESVWALGDCNGKGAFTHTAYNDYEIVSANLLDQEERRVSERIQAHALYIDPPFAQIGLTEAQVRASGRKALIATRPMTRVGRAVEKGETKGFMKILVDAESHMILGAGILGVGGDEAIHCVLDIMQAQLPYTSITHTVHIHPTIAELIPTLLEELHPLS